MVKKAESVGEGEGVSEWSTVKKSVGHLGSIIEMLEIRQNCSIMTHIIGLPLLGSAHGCLVLLHL